MKETDKFPPAKTRYSFFYIDSDSILAQEQVPCAFSTEFSSPIGISNKSKIQLCIDCTNIQKEFIEIVRNSKTYTKTIYKLEQQGYNIANLRNGETPYRLGQCFCPKL